MVSQMTFNQYIFIMYWLCVIIGSFYLLNLTIAVLGTEFENAQEKIREEELHPKNEKIFESYSLKRLNSLGIYNTHKNIHKKESILMRSNSIHIKDAPPQLSTYKTFSNLFMKFFKKFYKKKMETQPICSTEDYAILNTVNSQKKEEPILETNIQHFKKTTIHDQSDVIFANIKGNHKTYKDQQNYLYSAMKKNRLVLDQKK